MSKRLKGLILKVNDGNDDEVDDNYDDYDDLCHTASKGVLSGNYNSATD